MKSPLLGRRSFIGSTTLVGAGLAAQSAWGQSSGTGSKKVKFGLIGCGGRGRGAVKDFMGACKILGLEPELVAVADAFEDKASSLGKHYEVAEKSCFSGFDAYKEVIATDCEYVLMATPPSFRPIHFDAAVEAGKHCFIEKPVAVDPVGARSVIATGEKAKAKGLAVVCGTQRRHTYKYLRNKALIDAGAIGEIRGGVVQWNSRVPWVKPRQAGDSDADYMARNWLNFYETSGDHIVEQHVHNLDVAVWFLGRLPLTALGFGGRARRVSGNMFDFFSIDLDFGDDVHIHSQCRQISGTYGRVGESFVGTEGACYGGGKLKGKDVKIPEITVDTDNGQQQEHVDLIRSVRAGKPLNQAKRIAEVTAVAIMSRMSAYTGEMIRLNDLLKNEQSPHYNYTCKPTPLDFEKGTVKMPAETPPIPGEEDKRFANM
ncbi:MAG: Gfo/Idh/MocA family oxidoreductase [Verrucomicrobiae bacterium]|nr:Gfo/Idh/MocA family oxidoreductase [Verrucomicrobiae bacterium]NNJ42199.1 Gfo/Idh/MocA family oxidoreductase [Akkermansiaceae bacterium]